MARLVAHDDRSPLKVDATDIDEDKGDIAICRCGLADSYPFCDGSHRATADEDLDGEVLYRYGDDDREDANGGSATDGDSGESKADSDSGSRQRRIVERIVYAEE